MQSKEYKLPNGKKAVFEYDVCGIGKITLECMDELMGMIADRQQEWIPCSERLPEPGSWAIWCSVKGIIQVARWKEDAIDHFFPDQGFFQLDDAVAWLPLPKPWKGGIESNDHNGEADKQHE